MAMILTSCGHNYYQRIVKKSLPLPGQNATIDWYYYSLISGFSPGNIELKMKNSHELICESGYISDIKLKHDTLIITLWENVYKKPNIFLQFNSRLSVRVKVVIDSAIGSQP
jgi:hypothetical protein